MPTTIGRQMLNRSLPEGYEVDKTVNKDDIDDLLGRIARESPEKYKDTVHRLMRNAERAAYESGSTLGIKDTYSPIDRRPYFDTADEMVESIMSSDMPDDEKRKALGQAFNEIQNQVIDETYGTALAADNPFARQVAAKARGKPDQLTAIMSTPGVYQDSDDVTVPVFIRRSFAEGLKPHEYFAGTYGARKGVLGTKFCLDEDTEVLVGDNFDTCRIKDIRPGTTVWTVDEDNCLVSTRVSGVTRMGRKHCRMYGFGRPSTPDSRKVVATPEHRILMERMGDEGAIVRDMEPLYKAGEDGRSAVLPLAPDREPRQDGLSMAKREYMFSVAYEGEEDAGLRTVYDLEVEHPSHRFVLANGLIVSNSTRDAGYLGKQMNNAAMRLQVTRDDCETPNGVPVDPSDDSNTGTVLAHNAGDYKRGTVITPDVQKDLAGQADEIIVRSPTTCAEPKGICKQCAGIRESGGFPELGDNVGVNAVSALAERVAQGSLNLKHCISLNTKVLRADWSECRICDLKVGDEVMGSDKGGCIRPVKVLNKFYNGMKGCWCTEFINNASHPSEVERIYLDSTLDHKMLAAMINRDHDIEDSDNAWREIPVGRSGFEAFIAARIRREDHDEYDSGAPVDRVKRVDSVYLGLKPTMDIEVDHPDHMFVLANGLIVSNSGGLGGEEEREFSGFPVVSQLVEVPKNFPHGAAVAEKSGEVSEIREAPQGGHWIDVDGEQHYTPSQLPPTVEKGDIVEAGDQLAQGVVNPRDVVRLKGLGEGRRYFTDRFTKAMQDSGYAADRRNVELLSRALFDDVEVENTSDHDGISDAIPGDIMAYGSVAHNYKPRKTSEARPVDRSEGSYLEEPALHYTVGTKLSRSMTDRLKKHGYTNVRVNDEPPAFKPRMASLRDLPGREKDWVAQLGMNYLKKNLLENAQTGAESQHHSLHPVPAMARGKGLGDTPDGVGY